VSNTVSDVRMTRGQLRDFCHEHVFTVLPQTARSLGSGADGKL
jgi:hypothetical protein